MPREGSGGLVYLGLHSCGNLVCRETCWCRRVRVDVDVPPSVGPVVRDLGVFPCSPEDNKPRDEDHVLPHARDRGRIVGGEPRDLKVAELVPAASWSSQWRRSFNMADLRLVSAHKTVVNLDRAHDHCEFRPLLDDNMGIGRRRAFLPLGCGCAWVRVGSWGESKQTGQVDCTGRRVHTTYIHEPRNTSSTCIIPMAHLRRQPNVHGSRAAVPPPVISRANHVEFSAIRRRQPRPLINGPWCSFRSCFRAPSRWQLWADSDVLWAVYSARHLPLRRLSRGPKTRHSSRASL
jgi:hypothetical protein